MMRTGIAICLLVSLLAGGVAYAGWEEGVAAYKAGNYSQAVKELQGVVEEQPEFAGGHLLLGNSLLKLDKNQDALTHLRKAYELDPSSVAHQLALGQAYLANGRYGEAAQVLQKINAASLPKAQQNAHQQMLAVALSKSGQGDQALSALKKVAEANPNSAAAWYSYGTAAFNADDLDTALTALEKAVRLDGDDAKKRESYLKAMILKARKATSSAQKKQAYAKAIPVAQTLASQTATYDHLLTLGEIQLGAGEYNDAVESLKKAVAKNGNDFYGHFYLAQTYTSLGNWSSGETAAKKALSLTNQEREKKLVWTQIGFINEKIKNYSAAKEAYRNAGNMDGLRRVEENERIAQENQEIEQHNRKIDELAAEQEELERQLEELQGPPPQR